MSRTILVSACLVGLRTRYDGRIKLYPHIQSFFTRHQLIPIPVCPEQLAGLPTPRPCTWFTSGSGKEVLAGDGAMIDSSGKRMNDIFILGAGETLKIAQASACRAALLKERSPSCGVHQVYLEDRLVSGCGVTSALLTVKGVKIFNEEELDKLI
jgi:uncharacterized protein YbbK (DUF523 family)